MFRTLSSYLRHRDEVRRKRAEETRKKLDEIKDAADLARASSKQAFDARVERIRLAAIKGDLGEVTRALQFSDEELGVDPPLEAKDVQRAYSLGMARGRSEGRAEEQASMIAAMLPPQPIMNMDNWTPEQVEDLQRFAKAANLTTPQFHRTTQEGGIHMYSDREDMVRDSLKEMSPADRVDTLLRAGVIPVPHETFEKVREVKDRIEAKQRAEDVARNDEKLDALAAWRDYEKQGPNRTVEIPLEESDNERWEPEGDLGNSEAHVRVSEKQITLGIQLDTIAGIIQSWINYAERRYRESGDEFTNDTAVMQLPMYPTVGQLRRWIEVLRAPMVPLTNEGICNYGEGCFLCRKPAFSEAHKAEQDRINRERSDMLARLVTRDDMSSDRPDSDEPLIYGTVCNTQLPHDPPLPEVRIESDVDGQRVSSPCKVQMGDEPGVYRADVPPMRDGDTLTITGGEFPVSVPVPGKEPWTEAQKAFEAGETVTYDPATKTATINGTDMDSDRPRSDKEQP